MAATIDPKDLHRIVVTCVIQKGNEFLIKKRRSDIGPFPGRWEVAGGGVERRDYINLPRGKDGWENVLERVIRREVWDETGLIVGTIYPIGNSFCIREDDDIAVLVLRYSARYASGVVTLDAEATEYKWITAQEVDAYDLIGSGASDIRERARAYL